MRVNLLSWKKQTGWPATATLPRNAQLVFYFGARLDLELAARFDELREIFPDAHLIGCSTGGQIRNDEVFDDEIAAVAVTFDTTRIRLVWENIAGTEASHACGAAIGERLAGPDLAGIFVLSDGLNVNGSGLVAGIASVVGNSVPLTGGMAGDGADFKTTLVGADFAPRANVAAAVGFYGSAVQIGHGSAGGWDQFGPRRRITRSAGNVLYELDGEPALDLYERYLGEEDAKGLPSTGLFFPLRVYEPGRADHDIVRTILAVDRDTRSMTFAGDMPQGWVAQLMRGNFDGLAAGAAHAAHQSQGMMTTRKRTGDELAVLVSCIGRRLVLGQNSVDEVEAAGVELGDGVTRIGFYSYGEISPHNVSGVCQLHNQTMTITTISESAA